MQKNKKYTPWIFVIIILFTLMIYRTKNNINIDVNSSTVEESTHARLSSYPNYIGDEGVLDASKPEFRATTTETKSPLATKDDSSVIEENKTEVTEETQDEGDVEPASSEVNIPESIPSIVPSTPKTDATKIIKKEQIVMPKSNLAFTDYLLPLSNSEERIEQPTHIVVHFTSNALNKPSNPYLIEDTYENFKSNGVSSHYVIGRAGEMYSLVAEDRVAYHAGPGSLSDFPLYNERLNHYSIGIELLAIGSREEMMTMIPENTFNQIDASQMGYTEAQYQALNTLINDIISRNPTIQKNRKQIVGHDEYAPSRKMDPGSLFNWSKLGF